MAGCRPAVPSLPVQHQRVEPEIGGVERPAEPHDEKNQPLIPADRPQPAKLRYGYPALVHRPPPTCSGSHQRLAAPTMGRVAGQALPVMRLAPEPSLLPGIPSSE